MIAYNKTSLDNLMLIRETEKAFKKGAITAEERDNIKAAYPVALYMPNIYLRIGLFILTSIVASFSFGLLCLILLGDFGENTFGGLCIFFSIIAYVVVELLIKDKHHYKSGADAALLWISGGCMIGGVAIFSGTDVSITALAYVVLLLSTYFTLRFADTLFAIVAFLALLYCIFNLFMHTRLFLPFLIMGVSFGVYYAMGRIKAKYHANCLQAIRVCALLTLYLGGNYFVIRQVNEAFYDDASLPAAGMFWISTVIIPLVYIYLGLRKKDRVLLRSGLILIAAIVFTVRYYHSVAPLEIAMTVGGLIMILFAYSIMRYLKAPKHGFTADPEEEENPLEALQIESLVIAQTFHQAPGPGKDQFDFGGGSGSGGGASGEF